MSDQPVFTETPWTVKAHGKGEWCVVRSFKMDNEERAHEFIVGEIADKELARLISAAPELFELLQEADRRIIWEGHGFGNEFADRVEAALQKARGET